MYSPDIGIFQWSHPPPSERKARIIIQMHKGPHPPAQIGPYVGLRPLNTGAACWVLKGRHSLTGRIAALKVAGSAPEDRGRLRHEAQVISRLSNAPHPGIVELLEMGVDRGVPWLALRFVEGPRLSACRVGDFEMRTWTEAARIGRCIADALTHAHDRGIAHGDLSTANVLLENGANPVLIDFGAAALTFDGGAMREVVHRPLGRCGTPGYASPEQILGRPVDIRTDLYALGCILYELICGAPPFRADTVEALCQQHLHLAPPAPSFKRPRLPAELNQLVLSLLAKEPRARTTRAPEVAAILARYSADGEAHSNLSTPHPPRLHRPQLVGREAAMASLMTCLSETAGGSGCFVLVSGMSGIGKTRVLNELAHRAQGFRVMYGRCGKVSRARSGEAVSAGRALEPFSPLLEWLAHPETHPPNAETFTAALAALAPYESTLEGSLILPAIPPLPPELGRSRVLRSLLEVLLLTATQEPLLLIVDDLQWADDLSLAFLQEQYLTALKTSKILIVAAHRSEDPAPASLTGDIRRVELAPLNGDQIGTMAMEMLGAELVPTGLAGALHRHSEGNPFFAAEYLRAFVECGVLQREPGSDWQLPELRFDTTLVAVPSSLRDVFTLRVGRLSPTAKDALEVSALLGRQFRGALLEAIMPIAARGMVVRDALSELVARHILDPCGADQFRFVHDKLREAQSQAISDDRRQVLHRRIATLLDEPGCIERFGVSASELGLHWAEAREPGRAVAPLKLAAEQAAAQYMNADAAILYALALSQIEIVRNLADVTQHNWNAQAISIGEARGDLLGWGARHEEACAQHDACLRLAEGQDLLVRARLERKKARAHWTLHEYESAATALNHAEELLGPVTRLNTPEEIHEWIEIQQGFFWLHYYARRAGSSTESLMQKMATVAEHHGTPVQKSMLYVCASSEVMARDRYSYSDTAVAYARLAIVQVSDIPDQVYQLAYARFVLAFALLQGTPAQCREATLIFEKNLQALTPIGEATLVSRSLVYQAIAWRRCGDAASTSAVAALARRSAERVRLAPYIGATLACDAWVLWKSGDTEAAKRLAEEAHTWWARVPHSFPFYWLANFVLLDSCYMREDFDAAARVVSEMLDTRQQRLHEQVHASLLDCAITLESGAEARDVSTALHRSLELARQHCYL